MGSYLKKVINGVETTIYPYTTADLVKYNNETVQSYLEKVSNLVSSGSRQYWSNNPTYVPKLNELIIYQDGEVVQEGSVSVKIPWLKVGDGTSIVSALPFIGVSALSQHINNAEIHVSSSDRSSWDNKVSMEVNGETLVFSL